MKSAYIPLSLSARFRPQLQLILRFILHIPRSTLQLHEFVLFKIFATLCIGDTEIQHGGPWRFKVSTVLVRYKFGMHLMLYSILQL